MNTHVGLLAECTNLLASIAATAEQITKLAKAAGNVDRRHVERKKRMPEGATSSVASKGMPDLLALRMGIKKP